MTRGAYTPATNGYHQELPRARPRRRPPAAPPRYPAFAADSAVATSDPGALCPVDHLRGSRRRPLRTRLPADITTVLIHTIQGGFTGSVERWTGRSRPIACHKPHYAVKGDGTSIVQLVPELNVSAHGNGANAYSVGIEHDGFANDPVHYTEAMYVASSRLTRDICTRRGIAMNRTGVIGHDEAPGTSHGDPGGYWDWDYYMALVNWDGTPATKPTRIVCDLASGHLAPGTSAWTRRPRGAVRHAPHPEHAWGSRWLRAPRSARLDDPAIFTVTIPATGSWDLSLWWPVLPANCPAVAVTVKVGGAPILTTTVNQRARAGRRRSTLALPNTPIWFSLGSRPFAAGDICTVEVSRRSAVGGFVIADALRLLKT